MGDDDFNGSDRAMLVKLNERQITSFKNLERIGKPFGGSGISQARAK